MKPKKSRKALFYDDFKKLLYKHGFEEWGILDMDSGKHFNEGIFICRSQNENGGELGGIYFGYSPSGIEHCEECAKTCQGEGS